VDRVLPNSLEAEMGLLGSVLLAPNEMLVQCVDAIGVEHDHFYQHAHKVIYQQLAEMHETGEAVDPVTLTQRLKDHNRLDEVGGPIYVTNLFTSVPTAGNFKYYLGIVREKFILRRLIETSTQIVTRCYEQQQDVDKLLDEAEREMFQICERGVLNDAKKMDKVIENVFTTIEKLYNNKGALTGLSTGFRDYDKLTSGLHGGEMTILAARPGVGKTAFALNIAESVAIDQKQPVGIFSLEMSAESLVMRMLCSRARVDSHKVRSGFLGKADFAPLTNAASELIKAPIFIDDSANLSILHLRAKGRRMMAESKVRLLIVDYLQLVTDESSRSSDGRQAEVAAVSRQLKALAKELNVPILVLCQLNREIEKRGENARPRLADLRESGSIEQDADLVSFLVRKDDGEGGGFSPTGEAELVIAKQRNGPQGDVKLVFKGEYTRFFDAAKTTDEDAQEIRGSSE
jgi:replicative DNA helicase